jgi:hypothetical protein
VSIFAQLSNVAGSGEAAAFFIALLKSEVVTNESETGPEAGYESSFGLLGLVAQLARAHA